MSPEILVQDDNSFEASLHNLMTSHKWSLGMTFFTMVNPNIKCPYLLEIRSAKETIATQGDVQKFVSNLLHNKILPKSDGKYNTSRATVWFKLEEDRLTQVYMGYTNFDSNERFTLRDIDEVLDGRCDVYKTCDVLKLRVTQSKAIKQADHHIPKLMDNHMQSNGPVSVPNEGTNTCAFLAVKIGDRIIHELDGNISDTVSLAEMIREVIWCLPEKINVNSDVAKLYDMLGAYSILSEVKVLNSRYEFFEELPFADCIYSFVVVVVVDIDDNDDDEEDDGDDYIVLTITKITTTSDGIHLIM